MKTLLADPFVLKLEKLVLCTDAIVLHVKTRSHIAACPACHQQSAKIHRHDTRCVADLPWEGITVRIHLQVRKFFCYNEAYARHVFCERLPSVVAPYSRQTKRLNEALIVIGLALGGSAGARTADSLGLCTSAETLLRRVRQKAQDLKPEAVRVLGVDDWAKRKGFSYGTILVDIERSRPIEMLPDREAGTLAAWLKGRSGIEVVTRDRATFYADGITAGAPTAVQVAERRHLLKNLREVVERVINGHRRKLREAAQTLSPYRTASELAKAHSLPELRPKQWSPRSTKELVRQQAKRARRVERYEEIKALRAAGASISAIARRMGMQRETVRHFLRADEYPEARPPRKPSRVEPFAEYLKERWLAGCYNAMQLYREIKARGYGGHVKVLQAYLEAWRKLLPEELRRRHGVPDVSPPAPRKVVWWLLKDEAKLKEEERVFVEKLTKSDSTIAMAQKLACEFQRMIRARDENQLNRWFETVAQSGIVEFRNFAKGLRQDEAAVRAAMTYQWSNGMVEGHVNRLKLIKRQMYGRAKLDLLRARVLLAA